jgi:hypothetical protein
MRIDNRSDPEYVGEQCLGNNFVRCAMRNDFAVEDDVQAVAIGCGQIQVVNRRQSRDAHATQEGKQFDQMLQIEVIGGLIENQQTGLLGERSRQQHALLFAAGEGVEVPLPLGRHADLFKRCVGDGRVFRCIAAKERLMRRAPHIDDVEHGQAEVPRKLLQDDGGSQSEPLSRFFPDVFAVKLNRRGVRRVEAEGATQQAGLALPFGPTSPTKSPGLAARLTSRRILDARSLPAPGDQSTSDTCNDDMPDSSGS